MDYEKKYNEALERAKYYHDRDNIQFLENIFPELKESDEEDKKIRNWLIGYFHQYKEDGVEKFANGLKADKILSWLEKQGEHKHQYKSRPRYVGEDELLGANKQGEQKPNPYSGTSFEYDGHTWGMCARDNGVELLLDGELKAFLSLEKSFIYPIHPQPELAPKSALEATKEEEVDNANKVEPKDYNDIDPHFGKPIDEVEPKFNVGDWIIFNGLTLYIKEIVKGYYRTISKGGIPNSYDWDIDNAARLWTIQEAKDGDVLASGGVVFIFKAIHGVWLYCHCSAHKDGSFIADSYNLLTNKYFGEVQPATKEQRDLLFQKMKEAGYAFDFDKKELMKIEQKPVPKFEVGDVMRTLQESADNITSGLPVVVSIDDEYYRCNNELIAIKDQDDYEYPPMNRMQKSWGEEEEKQRRQIERIVSNAGCTKNLQEKIHNWFDSLKDRVQPQSTWKPSGEQIGALEHFVRNIAESGFASPYDNNTKLVYSLLNDLKKLKL